MFHYANLSFHKRPVMLFLFQTIFSCIKDTENCICENEICTCTKNFQESSDQLCYSESCFGSSETIVCGGHGSCDKHLSKYSCTCEPGYGPVNNQSKNETCSTCLPPNSLNENGICVFAACTLDCNGQLCVSVEDVEQCFCNNKLNAISQCFCKDKEQFAADGKCYKIGCVEHFNASLCSGAGTCGLTGKCSCEGGRDPDKQCSTCIGNNILDEISGKCHLENCSAECADGSRCWENKGKEECACDFDEKKTTESHCFCARKEQYDDKGTCQPTSCVSDFRGPLCSGHGDCKGLLTKSCVCTGNFKPGDNMCKDCLDGWHDSDNGLCTLCDGAYQDLSGFCQLNECVEQLPVNDTTTPVSCGNHGVCQNIPGSTHEQLCSCEEGYITTENSTLCSVCAEGFQLLQEDNVFKCVSILCVVQVDEVVTSCHDRGFCLKNLKKEWECSCKRSYAGQLCDSCLVDKDVHYVEVFPPNNGLSKCIHPSCCSEGLNENTTSCQIECNSKVPAENESIYGGTCFRSECKCKKADTDNFCINCASGFVNVSVPIEPPPENGPKETWECFADKCLTTSESVCSGRGVCLPNVPLRRAYCACGSIGEDKKYITNNYDNETACTTCLGHFDLASNCMTCLDNYDLNTGCHSCIQGFDSATECKTCASGFDPADDCSSCIGGFTMLSNCQLCEVGYEKKGDICVEVENKGTQTTVIVVCTILGVAIIIAIVVGIFVVMRKRRETQRAVDNANAEWGENVPLNVPVEQQL